ncbi:aminodeoxychorismate synthase, component I [Halorientalis sp. IM1011]|uniref:aminodeoxychorismate synthase, component I n=1 Tax=Halorientalis sp. IM1011 TaxID=1932360 RepID=UPI00097CCC2C|nr:aminodeoxychorismate synthase, component I [Halorientalis sp. IM1011]AQL41904.1 aminodeoxychorismate synthase, component I [Halorientalis sp. IM1011]
MTTPTVVTDGTTFRSVADGVAPGTRVPVEVRVTVQDPFTAYRRARPTGGTNDDGTADGDSPHGVYLETTGGQSGWGYFGVDPVDWVTVGPEAGNALAALGDRLADESLARGECDVPYPCGAVGWLSYDLARDLESLPGDAARDRDLPRVQVALYDRLAAWEEPRDEETTLRVTTCPRVDPDGDRGRPVAAAYDHGLERARDLIERATGGDPAVGPPPVDADTARFESDCGRAAFADRVRRVEEYVRDGDTFQTNVSQRLTAPAAVHPVEAFDALRRVNPAPYSALVEFPGVDLVSASPELLLERDGDELVTEPIAGTRPRGETEAEDDDLERDLRTDEKERAEHAMLVDLERNDLGKVSEYGSVEVTDYRRVDRYSEVMHLVSEVRGRLRDGADLTDAIAAVFPGGTITGAPKPRTMEIIDEVEATRRGPYTGSIGIFGFDGRATLNIVIRTLVRYGSEYHLRVGAGIVHDSVPDREYEETLDKARALVTAVDEALGRRGDLAVEAASDGGEAGSKDGDGGQS